MPKGGLFVQLAFTQSEIDVPKDRVAAAETGADILRCFAQLGAPLALSAIAVHAGMQPAKVHRYLRAFIASGMLVQHAQSRAYDLGPLAFSLGIAALQRYDIVRAASERLTEFCHRSGESASILVWGSTGPTVIRSENSRQDVVVALRVGGTVQLTTSSAGRVFAAFLDPTFVAPLVDAEYASPAQRASSRPQRAEFQKLVAAVRATGFAAIEEGPIDGVAALSSPLIAPDGRIAGVISAIGRRNVIDLSTSGPLAAVLTTFITSLQPRF